MQGQILADIRKMLDDFGADSAYKMLVSREQDTALKNLQSSQHFTLVVGFPSASNYAHTSSCSLRICALPFQLTAIL